MRGRCTQSELYNLAMVASETIGEPMSIGYAYGSPRLESADGSRDISPRLPAGQLREWIWAYIQGVRDYTHCQEKKGGAR